MAYDFTGEVQLERGTPEWFAETDRRFIDASRPYLTRRQPFDPIMPDDLSGMRVLEIGCGMGLHCLELARRGATVEAVDLTDVAVDMTRARMARAGLSAVVQRADAESLPYPSQSFDFVWSWGVVHLSARTARAVREIARVLKPTGEARVMVYNRDGRIARMTLLYHHLVAGGFVRRTPDETLWRWSDGHSARYYHREQFEDLFRAFFSDVSAVILGQESDVVPLPHRARAIVAPRLSEGRKLAIAARVGGFIFFTAARPDCPR
jgi:SAM-dependent methyltransferase